MIQVSAATANITPVSSVPLAGRPNRDGGFSRIESQLEANILFLRENKNLLVLIGVDTLFSSNEWINRIQLKLHEIPQVSLLLTDVEFQLQTVASHTHSAPSLDPSKPLLGEIDESYFNNTAHQVAGKIATTLINSEFKQPQFKIGHASCDQNIYRRAKRWVFKLRRLRLSHEWIMAPNKYVTIDHRLSYLLIEDTSGNPICVIWSWPCHAVAMSDADCVSSDFPGAVRNAIRKKYSDGTDLPILYFPGLSGDIKPAITKRFSTLKQFLYTPFTPHFYSHDKREYSCFCDSVVKAALEAQKSTEQSIVTNAESTLSVKQSAIPTQDLFYQKIPQLSEYNLTATSIEFEKIRILLITAEVCSPYRDILKTDNYLFASGCCDNVYGYLPSNKQVFEGGYEANVFTRIFSINAKFIKNVETHIVSLVTSTTR